MIPQILGFSDLKDSTKRLGKELGKAINYKFEVPLNIPGDKLKNHFQTEAKADYSKLDELRRFARLQNDTANSLLTKAKNLRSLTNITSKEHDQIIKKFGSLKCGADWLELEANSLKNEVAATKLKATNIVNNSKCLNKLARYWSSNALATAGINKAGFAFGELMWDFILDPTAHTFEEMISKTGQKGLAGCRDSLKTGCCVYLDTKIVTSLNKYGWEKVAKKLPSLKVLVTVGEIIYSAYKVDSIDEIARIVAESACDLGCLLTVARIASATTVPGLLVTIAVPIISGFASSALKNLSLFPELSASTGNQALSLDSLALTPELIDQLKIESGINIDPALDSMLGLFNSASAKPLKENLSFSSLLNSAGAKPQQQPSSADVAQSFAPLQAPSFSEMIMSQYKPQFFNTDQSPPRQLPQAKIEPRPQPSFTMQDLLKGTGPTYSYLPGDFNGSSDSQDKDFEIRYKFSANNATGEMRYRNQLDLKFANDTKAGRGVAIAGTLAYCANELYKFVNARNQEKQYKRLQFHLTKVKKFYDSNEIAEGNLKELRNCMIDLDRAEAIIRQDPDLQNVIDLAILKRTTSELNNIERDLVHLYYTRSLYNRAVNARKWGRPLDAAKHADEAEGHYTSRHFMNFFVKHEANQIYDNIKLLKGELGKDRLGETIAKAWDSTNQQAKQISTHLEAILKAPNQSQTAEAILQLEKLQEHEALQNHQKTLDDCQKFYNSLPEEVRNQPINQNAMHQLFDYRKQAQDWINLFKTPENEWSQEKQLYMVKYYTNQSQIKTAHQLSKKLMRGVNFNSNPEMAAKIAESYYNLNTLAEQAPAVEDFAGATQLASRVPDRKLKEAIGLLFFQTNEKCRSNEALDFYREQAYLDPDNPIWQALKGIASHSSSSYIDRHFKDFLNSSKGLSEQETASQIMYVKHWAFFRFQEEMFHFDLAKHIAIECIRWGAKTKPDGKNPEADKMAKRAAKDAEKTISCIKFSTLPPIQKAFVLKIVPEQYRDHLKAFFTENEKRQKILWNRKEFFTGSNLVNVTSNLSEALNLFIAVLSIVDSFSDDENWKKNYNKANKILNVANTLITLPTTAILMKEMYVNGFNKIPSLDMLRIGISGLQIISLIPTCEEVYHAFKPNSTRSTYPLMIGLSAFSTTVAPVITAGSIVHQHHAVIESKAYWLGNKIVKRLPNAVLDRVGEKAKEALTKYGVAAVVPALTPWVTVVAGTYTVCYTVISFFDEYGRQWISRKFDEGEKALSNEDLDTASSRYWEIYRNYSRKDLIDKYWDISHRIDFIDLQKELKKYTDSIKLYSPQERVEKLTPIEAKCERYLYVSNDEKEKCRAAREPILIIMAALYSHLNKGQMAFDALKEIYHYSEKAERVCAVLPILMSLQKNIPEMVRRLIDIRKLFEDEIDKILAKKYGNVGRPTKALEDIDSLIDDVIQAKAMFNKFTNYIQDNIRELNRNPNKGLILEATCHQARKQLIETHKNLIADAKAEYPGLLTPKELQEVVINTIDFHYQQALSRINRISPIPVLPNDQPPSNDVDLTQNASNSSEDEDYLYEATDINFIVQSPTFKELLRNFQFIQCLAIEHMTPRVNEIIDQVTSSGKPALCVYNISNIHWVTFCVLQWEGQLLTLYKDSMGGEDPAFITLLREKTLFKSHAGREQIGDVKKCGIFALDNSRIMAIALTNNREEFIRGFENSEFCTLDKASDLRRNEFPRLYLEGYNEHVRSHSEYQVRRAQFERAHEHEWVQLFEALRTELSDEFIVQEANAGHDAEKTVVVKMRVINTTTMAYDYWIKGTPDVDLSMLKALLHRKFGWAEGRENDYFVESDAISVTTKIR